MRPYVTCECSRVSQTSSSCGKHLRKQFKRRTDFFWSILSEALSWGWLRSVAMEMRKGNTMVVKACGRWHFEEL